MQTNACMNQIGAVTVAGEGFSSVEAAVGALAIHNKLDPLASVAKKRLEGLASCSYGQRLRGLKDPVELVNQAVELVLSGKRKALAQNMASLPAFMDYMQGVLQSVITHELERIVRQGEYIPLDSAAPSSSGAHQLEAPDDVVNEAILNDSEAART